jgi:RNA-binding protein NOB1
MDGSWASSMDGSWSTPKNEENLSETKVQEDRYYSLIVDSGAIIKHSGFSTLHNAASKYFTTQGVIDEIRDSKARHHLDSLPFQLDVREPSPDGMLKVVDFSKKTGDYASLSTVDLNVLALLYDLGTYP